MNRRPEDLATLYSGCCFVSGPCRSMHCCGACARCYQPADTSRGTFQVLGCGCIFNEYGLFRYYCPLVKLPTHNTHHVHTEHARFVCPSSSPTGTFPIDTTKTRLQIQGQRTDNRTATPFRYNGMIDAFVKISRQEGVNALYSG